MKFFLDERFYVSLLDDVAGITDGDYYLDMMKAWFFAEALVKRYEETVPYLERYVLRGFVRDKTIQKAIESFRVPSDRKDYLKSIKR